MAAYVPLFHVAATHLQRMMRGYLARKAYRSKLALFLEHRIDVPAATRIQRTIVRGRKGRKVAARKRLELQMCIRIQLFARKYVNKVWALAVRSR